MSYVRSPTPITLGWLWFQNSRSYGVGALERDGGKKTESPFLIPTGPVNHHISADTQPIEMGYAPL